MMTSRRASNALSWLLVSIVTIALDQWTKSIALGTLQEGVPHPVIAGFMNWTLAFNTGAAFSFLADAGGWQRWGFSALAITVCIFLTVWLSRTPRQDWRNALPLALVIGGALGNLIDRLRFGHVVDFIQVYYDQWAWPAFNIADSSIFVGAMLLAWFTLRAGKNQAAAG